MILVHAILCMWVFVYLQVNQASIVLDLFTLTNDVICLFTGKHDVIILHYHQDSKWVPTISQCVMSNRVSPEPVNMEDPAPATGLEMEQLYR